MNSFAILDTPLCALRPTPRSQPLPTFDRFESSRRFDKDSSTDLRGSVFGHPGAILTFREGLIAKFVGPGESAFYETYEARFTPHLPRDLVPEILGLLFQNDSEGSYDFQRALRAPPGETRRPLILQRDMAAGFAQPAIIDFKLGDRSWMIGDPATTAARRAEKMAGGLCPRLYFRVRAALWRGESPAFERIAGTSVSFVSRAFGNTCTMEQLKLLFRDFFRFREMLPAFIEKLARLKQAVLDLREIFDTRFYSSSVVVVYDNANPGKYDLRMLDFEKSYVFVEEVARKYNEPLEKCEDHVAEAVENIRAMLVELLEE